MKTIKPDQNNWGQFCQEPVLTKEEYAIWLEMAWTFQNNQEFQNFCMEKTQKEWEDAYQSKPRTEDWADMVEFADTNHRLQRAEIKAYKAWKEKQCLKIESSKPDTPPASPKS